MGNASESASGAVEVFQAGERSLCLHKARALIEQAIDAAGLTARLTDQGGAWRCHLHRRGTPQVPVAMGGGKGESPTAQVGALFEALEHYRSDSLPFRQGHVVLRSPVQLLAEEFVGDPALAAVPADAAHTPLACRTHTAVDGSGSTLDVPVFIHHPSYLELGPRRRQILVADAFDYRPVGRYSTNSGTAIGADITEALVHALAETIERDAYSLLLVATFLTRTPAPLRLVEHGSLPASLQALHDRAEQYLADSVALIDMTTDLDVPAFCAHASARRGHLMQGYGASLSAEYAAQRALSELMQVAAVAQEEDHPPPSLTHLEPHPRLLASARADFAACLDTARTTRFTPTDAPATPHGHLRQLNEALARRGYRAYGHVLHTEPNGIVTLTVFTPGLERFFAVTKGACIVPGPRARTAKQRAPDTSRPTPRPQAGTAQ
ncbi:YcaO-like family protein [Streptomyces sp. CSDS2]|uniref:YcaO-like family protein n=1 Tax=Streptomyces sp. CSDS2 TaxID=3055051 RepID=UPI0025B0DEA2|nr:YcaO-like family protein [Streptomyces sp. CSDS2]MDN3265781.1 YcaO-like family protein [Streptomyces sp. CSDS2]